MARNSISHCVGRTEGEALERGPVQVVTVDGLLVNFDNCLEVKVFVLPDDELGLFEHVLKVLKRVGCFTGRFHHGIEQFSLQAIGQSFGFYVDLKFRWRSERVLFCRQPEHWREPGTLVGHQDGLDDSAVPPHGVLVVQQVVSCGPVMPFVLHEPYNLRGYFAAEGRNLI